MNPDDSREWHRLFSDALSDQLSDADRSRLAAVLKSSAEARQLWFLYNDNECSLAELKRPHVLEVRKPGRSWFSLHPLATAAAGLILGVFCTSVVLAYVLPAAQQTVRILDAGFEDIPSPQALGVPRSCGQWSGDSAEIVGAHHGVTPHGGTKMWRFLRADNTLPPEAQASYVGEAIHVIDLKPLRRADVKAGSQIEISAWFAAGPTASDHRYHWNIKAAAFEGNASEAPELWGKWNETSTSLAQREVPAEKPGQWQQLRVTMLLPPNADFLVFECAVVQRLPQINLGVAEFPAHYVDDVRVRVLPPTHNTQAAE
ncbi:hypothetical protein [Humisphaera borealis]|uniref:Uncharacterized protein n=1 Tax=Humisphaera borealis TaxID=2807512 RepID=A0A7M2WS74_9BACT|nr:hypothetical protein [Humisphaera borealis]QOV88358.1 hypothetical protein IPV69_19195 [Humisphaera borealis]